MAKRGNGEGSISKRRNKDGKVIGWMAQDTVNLGAKGGRKSFYAKTRAGAVAKLEKFRSERASGLDFDAGKVTVGEYLDGWLSNSVKGNVKETTYSSYAWAHRVHIRPAFGDIRLMDLLPQHLRAFYGEKKRSGLAPATIRKMHIVLKQSLAQAVEDGTLPRNVALGIKTPKVTRPDEKVNALDREGAAAFLKAAKGERLEALYVIAMSCGLRRGELLALKWEDVYLDDERPALTVRRTLTRGEGGRGWVIGTTTKSGIGRRVRLTPLAVEALRNYRELQSEERRNAVEEWPETGLVFTTSNGTPMNPSNLRSRSFRRIRERSKVRKDFRFHDLRHTCATLLLRDDVNVKVVSEMLGHASVKITLSIYAHVLPDMQDSAAEAMEEILNTSI